MATPIYLRLPDPIVEKLVRRKPESLSMTAFCSLLLEKAVDTPVTLAERTEGSEASISSSLIKEEISNKQLIKAVSEEKIGKRKRVKPDYSEEFLAFWNEYQRAPLKSNSQSKNKAFEQWKKVVKEESPVRLVEAARRAVEQVRRAKTQDEWCAPLPDAFRWLRDERYSVLLEDHQPVGPRIIDGITVYD